MDCSGTWSSTGSSSRSGPVRAPVAARWSGGGRTGRRWRTCCTTHAMPGPTGSAIGRSARVASSRDRLPPASRAAVADVERGRAELARHWRLRRERAAQEVDRAARQYQACEPENRLVGRELEHRWEESLNSRRRLEDEYERWQRTAPNRLSP